MSDYPVYVLQRWDDVTDSWQDHGRFTTSRGCLNAAYADDPATHGLQNA